MKTYIVLYTHRHGVNSYVVNCERLPTEEEIIKACDIEDEYEPDRDDEYLEWEGAELILIP